MGQVRGIVRKIDTLGRVVFPSELLKIFKVDAKGRVNTEMEINFDGTKFTIQHYEKKSEATGIVRKIDPLGRLTLPKGLLTILGVDSKTRKNVDMEVLLADNHLYCFPAYSTCTFCNSNTNTVEVLGRYICTDCRNMIMK